MKTTILALTLLMLATSAVCFGAPPASVNVCPQAALDALGAIGGQSNQQYETNVPTQGTCNLGIVIAANGTASIVVGNTASYDGDEDQLIGVTNNSSVAITSLILSGPGVNPPPFAFEAVGFQDGICAYQPFVAPNTSSVCNMSGPNIGSNNYLGSATDFTNINAALTTGTVVFGTAIQPGATAFFSLEGPAGIVVLLGPTITKTFVTNPILTGGPTSISFTITNPSTASAGLPAGAGTENNIIFSDTLTGMTVTTPATTTVCTTGNLSTATGSISLTGLTLAAGASCTFTVNITGGLMTGMFPNKTSAVTSTEVPNGTNTGMATLTINAPTPPTPPTFSKAFGGDLLPGGSTTLTFTITNTDANNALTGINFTDSLPGGLTVVANSLVNNNCGGTFSAPTTTSLALANGTVGVGLSCTLIVTVMAPITATSGTLTNTTSMLMSSAPNVPPATAMVNVNKLLIPTLMKSFGTPSIGVNTPTTLTFTLTNPNANTALQNVAFSDPLTGTGLQFVVPSQVIITPPACAISTNSGSATIFGFSIPTLAAGATCTITVSSVQGITTGLLTNTTSTVTSTNADPGLPAIAVLNVFGPTGPSGDAFQVNYFANADRGDSVVDITNTGASAAGNICVNVYAFAPDEQLISCCSCPVTPNGLVSLSVNGNLLSNRLTAGVVTSGVIKLLATVPVGGSCSGSASTAATATLASGLVAFGTTLHAAPGNGSTFAVTERPFAIGTVSAAELTRIGTSCAFNQIGGSGFGICVACGTGGLGAVPQK